MAEVRKCTADIPVPDELLIGRLLPSPIDLYAAMQRNAQMTPEEREARIAAVKDQRRHLRERTGPVRFSLESLAERTGWSPEYLTHLCQPYCECEDTPDGWEICSHANDLGVSPYGV